MENFEIRNCANVSGYLPANSQYFFSGSDLVEAADQQREQHASPQNSSKQRSCVWINVQITGVKTRVTLQVIYHRGSTAVW